MRKILVSLLLATSALGTSAHADDAGPYITLEGGIVRQNHADVRSPATYLHTDNFTTGWEACGALGYDFGHFRLEAEGFYARSQLKSQSRPIGSPPPNGFFTNDTGLKGRTSTWAGMANALVGLGHWGGIKAYAGGGVGLAKTRLSENLPGTVRLSDHDHGFAWQALAGLGEQSARHLVGGLLEAMADHLRNSFASLPRRLNLVDRRLADIENYIMMNLTDPDLCHDKVAANCGISPRYLCYLLKANNTSFSEPVWKNRLPKARDWLVMPKTRNQPIHEIAYMSGLKSAAHFSRMFKSAYGVTPREFRAMQFTQSSLPNVPEPQAPANYYPAQLHAA